MSTSFFDDDDDQDYEAYQAPQQDIPAAAAAADRLPALPLLQERNQDDDHQLNDDLDLDLQADSLSTSSYIPAAGTSIRGARHSSVANGLGSSRYHASSSRGRGDSPGLHDILAHEGEDMDLLDRGKRESNVAKLMRCWINESGSPELLPFPRKLVERLVKDLASRKTLVRHVNATASGDDALYLQASLVATENMRAAHVLKAYTRQRIHKLEAHVEYYLGLPLEDRRKRLYSNELAHAEGYYALKREYLNNSAVDALPERIRVHEAPVAEPDLSSAVFCRVRRACGPVVLPESVPGTNAPTREATPTDSLTTNDDNSGMLMSFDEGSQHMLRYSTIRDLLAKDLLELI
ncbi:BQ5605_C001g00046 [Microbotryum silenes-dioicae]|uniref:BQ5605_C001g00046 protein n=1 Tax=Microbotryum silenes-dioicae TaxID=796604 RepID=A0A2X0P552_9BASI|nr:BQ5605_C001g00046 [Microbotryum silenes-dioicae]